MPILFVCFSIWALSSSTPEPHLPVIYCFYCFPETCTYPGILNLRTQHLSKMDIGQRFLNVTSGQLSSYFSLSAIEKWKGKYDLFSIFTLIWGPSNRASFYLICVLIISAEKEVYSKKIVFIPHKIRWVWFSFLRCKDAVEEKHRLSAHWPANALTACLKIRLERDYF